MAKVSRGKFRWLREEYKFRQWKKKLIAGIGQSIYALKPGDFVREVATRGYYEGCKKLNHEFDVETFSHTSVMENPTHLTLQRGKHKHHPTGCQRIYEVMSIEPIEETL